MKTDWYPRAAKRSWNRDGGSMIGGPPRGVLHETQTQGVPSYNNGGSAPHLTLKKDGTWQQHIPFSRAGRALRNLSGGVQTNRQGSVNIQIEVLAYSDKNDWTPAQIGALREFMSWAEVEWGIPNEFPLEVGAGSEYGYGNPVELEPAEWVSFTGWCAHQHVPENTHWDVGRESGLTEVFGPGMIGDDMFVKYGDNSEQVKFWQIIAGADPDGDYGPLTKAKVGAITSSDGMRVGPSEAVELLKSLVSVPVVPAPTPVPPVVVPRPLSVLGPPLFSLAETRAWAHAGARRKGSPYNETNIDILVNTYWRVGLEYGVRPDLALAQSAKETGFWTYKGDVGPWQWNFAGIGATGGVPGVSFPTLEAGVRAHLLRMKMYAKYSTANYDEEILVRPLDQRHWGKYPNIQDFDGKWAVPGFGYGDSIVNDYLKKIPS